MGYITEYERWQNRPELSSVEKAELLSMGEDETLLKDAFERNLTFGTAGLRGICGMGTNRMNKYTVRHASQGLANYLKKKAFAPSAVISFDSRLDSRDFAAETARVLAANGIKVFLFQEMMPVPVLSYAILNLKCSAGIMITASHNSKEYNGYKVYNEYGGQILDREAEEILGEIEDIDRFDDVIALECEADFAEKVQVVGDDLFESYMKELSDGHNFTEHKGVHIIYTPLNGSGRKPVSSILERDGYSFFMVPEQSDEDGNFPTCPSPNPEKEAVFELAKKYGMEQNADILIATDPDCDRVGAMVRHDGEYHLFSGNEMGILLFNFICECKEQLLFKFMYTSLVSTTLVDKIAGKHGVSVKRTPVGFKYIGKLISNSPEAFIFGFEESNGYLMGSYARDKDGVAGAYAIAQMASYYKEKGLDLVEVLDDIYKEYGYTVDKTVSMEIAGMDEMKAVMDGFRREDALRSAFSNVESYIDYKVLTDQASMLSGKDLVQLQFKDGARMIIRPSGTEPKIKLYYSASGGKKEDAMDVICRMMKLTDEYLKELCV